MEATQLVGDDRSSFAHWYLGCYIDWLVEGSVEQESKGWEGKGRVERANVLTIFWFLSMHILSVVLVNLLYTLKNSYPSATSMAYPFERFISARSCIHACKCSSDSKNSSTKPWSKLELTIRLTSRLSWEINSDQSALIRQLPRKPPGGMWILGMNPSSMESGPPSWVFLCEKIGIGTPEPTLAVLVDFPRGQLISSTCRVVRGLFAFG